MQQDLLGYDEKERLWRQQLAGFVLVELTGSRAVKLLRGVGFSQVDRHQFFPPVSWDATGSLIRMQNGFSFAGQELHAAG